MKICGVYRVKQYLFELLNVITLLGKADVYIGGDFNIDYSKNNDNRKDMETKYGLCQLIYDSSRPLYANTLIDLIFTNNPDISKSGSLNVNVSDHIPIFVVRKKVKIKPIRVEFVGRTYRNYSKDILANKMSEVGWNALYQLEDPDAIWDTLYNRLLTIINDICPFRRCCF